MSWPISGPSSCVPTWSASAGTTSTVSDSACVTATYPSTPRSWRRTGPSCGCVTLRPFEGGRVLESFYLDPALQGRGIGGAVLAGLLARTDSEGVPVRLQVLQGSDARRLYERHGFVRDREDAVDVYMVRAPRDLGA